MLSKPSAGSTGILISWSWCKPVSQRPASTRGRRCLCLCPSLCLLADLCPVGDGWLKVDGAWSSRNPGKQSSLQSKWQNEVIPTRYPHLQVWWSNPPRSGYLQSKSHLKWSQLHWPGHQVMRDPRGSNRDLFSRWSQEVLALSNHSRKETQKQGWCQCKPHFS